MYKIIDKKFGETINEIIASCYTSKIAKKTENYYM